MTLTQTLSSRPEPNGFIVWRSGERVPGERALCSLGWRDLQLARADTPGAPPMTAPSSSVGCHQPPTPKSAPPHPPQNQRQRRDISQPGAKPQVTNTPNPRAVSPTYSCQRRQPRSATTPTPNPPLNAKHHRTQNATGSISPMRTQQKCCHLDRSQTALSFGVAERPAVCSRGHTGCPTHDGSIVMSGLPPTSRGRNPPHPIHPRTSANGATYHSLGRSPRSRTPPIQGL
jgi:hypothetical protein